MRLIAAILVLTLVAIGAGAVAGLHLFAAAERVAEATGREVLTTPDSAVKKLKALLGINQAHR